MSRMHLRQLVLACTAFVFAALQGFGMYNIHFMAGITEGGVLGALLLIQYWTGLSPAVSGFIINASCYLLGWHTFGKIFLFYSFAAAAGYSAGYAIGECFPPLFPGIASVPFLAAVAGGVCVGICTGFCVRIGGAASGDDALAMSLSEFTAIPIQWIYLLSDLTVLLLSLTYIPLKKILFSLLTVILSGQLIGWIQKIKISRND